VKSGKGFDAIDTPTLPLTFGLQSISKAFLGVDISKPRKIRLGNWDNKVLNLDQITYAAYDALLSRDIYCYCYALLQKESRGIE
jgi:ribonuclease D